MKLEFAVLQAKVKTEDKAYQEILDNDKANPKPEDFESARGRVGRFHKVPKKNRLKGGGPGSGRKPLGYEDESLMEMGFMPTLPISKSNKPVPSPKKYVKATKRLNRLKARRPDLVESGFFEAAYSPDEARDDHGRWTSGMNSKVTNEPVIPTGRKHAAAGIIVKDKEGKYLIYSPKHNFGGYKNTFSKGTIDPGQTPQEAALRELKEETGIEAKITGHLGTVERDTSTTRYYTGVQTGGELTPSDESDNPRFVHINDLHDLLKDTGGHRTGDHEVLQLIKDQGGPLNVLHQKIGNQKGTNQGGFYRGSDGVERYVKIYNDKGQGHAEATANAIYNDLGVAAPRSQIFGKHDFASEIIKGGSTLETMGVTKDNAREVLKGFAADVLVGNWDVVGLTYDNILMKDGKAHRIDNGASFTYRAQGGAKPQALLNKTTEYEGFFNPAINNEYAKLTKIAGYKSADEIPSINKQVSKIVKLEKSSGGWDNYLKHRAPFLSDHERTQFAAMLTARTNQLAQRQPQKQPKADLFFTNPFPGGKDDATPQQVHDLIEKMMKKHPIKAAVDQFRITVAEMSAGGPGSGWFTENGHISHKVGTTHELGSPHSTGPAMTLKLKGMGFTYHHTHIVTLNHKKIPRDYFLDSTKKFAVIMEKGGASWQFGNVLTVGNKTVVTEKASGKDVLTSGGLIDTLKQNGYGEEPNKVEPAKIPPPDASHANSVAMLKDLGFTGPSPYGQATGTVSYTKGSEQFVVAKKPTGGITWEYTDGKSKASGFSVPTLETHLQWLKDNAKIKQSVADIKQTVATPKGTPFSNTKLDLTPKVETAPRFSKENNGTAWLEQKAQQLADAGFIYKSSKYQKTNGSFWHKYAAPGSTPASDTAAMLVEKPKGVHELLIYNDVANSGLVDESKVDSVDTKKTAPATAIGNKEIMDKAAELGFDHTSNGPKGNGSKWDHKGSGASLTVKTDENEEALKSGYLWKLVDKTGNTFATGKGPAKLGQSFEQLKSAKPATYTGPTVSDITQHQKQYESQEGIPKNKVVTDKAYYQKVADTVADVLKANPSKNKSKPFADYNGYTGEEQKQLRLQAASKLGVSADAINKVMYDIDNWTGSSFKSMREEGLKVIDKAKDADPAWIIEHEVTKQQLRKMYGDTIDISRGLKVSTYKSDEFPQDMTNQLVAIKALIQSASPKWEVALKSHGADSWSKASSTAKGFAGQGSGILIKMNNTPIEYVVTSHETNPKFGGGESEFVVAFPKGEIPTNNKNTVAASSTALTSDAAINGYIGTLRKAGWKIEVKGNKILIHEKYPQTGKETSVTAGGPGSGRHKEFLTPRLKKPKLRTHLSLKAKIALANYVPAALKEHHLAEVGENLVRDAIGGKVTGKDSEPFDVLSADDKHAIEVKTLMKQHNDKITMRGAAMDRKYTWARKNHATIHTVVLDMRNGTKKPSAVYYRAGVGSYRIGNMTKLPNGLADVQSAIKGKL